MTAEHLTDISEVAAELRTKLDEIELLTETVYGRSPVVDRETGEVVQRGEPGLEARYKRRRLEAHAKSTTIHPKRTVDQHNNAAETDAFEQWADWNAALNALRAAKERAHSLRQELSAKQTAARVDADLSR